MNTTEQKVVNDLMKQLDPKIAHQHNAEHLDIGHPEETEIQQAEQKIKEQLIETFKHGMGSLPEDPFEKIARELSKIHLDIKSGFEWFKSTQNLATKQDLKQTEQHIMSKLTEWAAQEQADLKGISDTLDTVVAGIAALDTLITNFQNSPGTLSPADQAAIDGIQSAISDLKTKASAISVAPPAPPTT